MKSARHLRTQFLSTLLFIFFGGGPTIWAQGLQAATSGDVGAALKPGQVIEDSLAPGDLRTYRLLMPAGQFARVEILRRDADMQLRTITPEGLTIGEAGIMRLSWISQGEGTYALKIQGPATQRKPVRYGVVLKSLHPAVATDHDLVLAQQKLLEGFKLRRGRAEDRLLAQSAFEESQSLASRADDVPGQCDALLLISDLVFNRGDLSRALAAATQAQELAHSTGEDWLEAEALAHITRLKIVTQHFDESLATANHSVGLYQTQHDQMGKHVLFENIAKVYGALGEHETAIELLQRVVTFARRIGNREGESYTLSSLAGAYRESGDFNKALAFQKEALQLAKSAGFVHLEGLFIADLGTIQQELGQMDEALKSYQRSLELSRQLGSTWHEAHARHLIGVLFEQKGDHAAAREWIQSSLPGLRASEQIGEEANALADLARVDRNNGNLAAAEDRVEAALDLYESVRGRIPTEEMRASFVSQRYRDYELAVQIEMELNQSQPGAGFDAAAFATSERVRARSLLDLLARGEQDLTAGADSKLLAQQRTLEAGLKEASAQQFALLTREHTPEEASQAEEKVSLLVRKLSNARAETRASIQRLSSIQSSHPASLADIQKNLLDEDTALLEYFLGSDKSYAWIVTRSSVQAFVLPGRAVVESLARAAYRQFSRDAVAGGPAARKLARDLLGAVERDLPKRVVVIADGSLQYIPFGALPLSSGELLLARHSIIYLPSMSTLESIRKAASMRSSATQFAAVLADPVYTADDPRVTVHSGFVVKTSAIPSVGAAERSAKQVGLLRFDRLYATRREAGMIRQLAGSNRVFYATGFHATREAAMGANVANARLLHFAVHGLLNPNHPELSGLVLSMVDAEGRPSNGFLAMRDVLDLHLHADLVVLSACETALGKEVHGEGLIGLTRGFMYAGAPRVVASLWKVPDLATSELMSRFYLNLIVKKLPASAALRDAQLWLRRDPRWKAPYYWAGFTLQGDWN